MKHKISTFFFLLSFSYLHAQNFPLTIKIVDADSSRHLKGALVYIDELQFGDTETDEYGIAYFEKVPEGKVTINIRKPGFLPERVNFNVADNPVINTILVHLKRVQEKKLQSPELNPKSIDYTGSIHVEGDNYGIIQGDNSLIGNVSIINPKIKERKLTEQQSNQIVFSLARFKGKEFDIWIPNYDLEIGNLAKQIKTALEKAGWVNKGFIFKMVGTYDPGIHFAVNNLTESDQVLADFFLQSTGFSITASKDNKDIERLVIIIGPNPENEKTD